MFYFIAHILPPIPSNLTFEERRQRKSLYLTWSLPETKTLPRGILYVLEHRNTTSVKPSWSHDTPWTTLLLVGCISDSKGAAMLENQQCGFRTGVTQTDLYKHRKELEA